MGALIPLPKDASQWVDPKTGQLTPAARHTLGLILDAIAASVTGPETSVIGNNALWATTDGKTLK